MKTFTLIFVITVISLLIVGMLASPTLAAMQCCGGNNHGNPCSLDTDCSPGGVCGGICNPLGSNTMTLNDLYIRMAQLALGATGLFGVLMFIYGGLILLTSAGNPEKVKKAKDTLAWAVGGIVVILLSASVVNYIFKNFSF